MSAPDTNVEKQTRRHRPALRGIAFAVAVTLIAAFVFTAWNSGETDEEPGTATVQPDG